MGDLLSISASDLQTIIPVLVIHGILIIIALVDLIKYWNVRNGKVLWIIVIVMLQIIGPIVYFIFGRGMKGKKANVR